ncbi:MAG: transporter substrate-binding domain-containing protein [Betaproteobacteria bacterium]
MQQTDRAEAMRDLAPRGELRVGLNLSNFLLVTSSDYGPQGIVPDLARSLAAEVGVPLRFVPYPSPGPLGDAVDSDAWDVAFLADEPARATRIAFSPAYLEIPAGYLVPPGSPIRDIAEVDRPGVRIASMDSGAYTLYLKRTLERAELRLAPTLEASFQLFVDQGLHALAGLQARLISDHQRLPGSRILPGDFTAVQQAIGTARGKETRARFLASFAQGIKAQGLVQAAIERHQVAGVRAAPP